MRYPAGVTGIDPTIGVVAAEPMIRLEVFAAVLAVLLAWELLAPRRRLTVGRWPRWPGNVGMVVIDTLLLRILFPTAAVGLALVAEAHGWGLLNVATVPDWLVIWSPRRFQPPLSPCEQPPIANPPSTAAALVRKVR